MKMKLIAVAVGAALAVPAVAMADVTVYGRAHVSVDFLDDGADYSETNLSSNSSRLGFKGNHEINPNLKPYCPSIVGGQFYYLYMFEDLYSRKIVGYEVHEAESGEYAAQLLQRTQLREQCLHKPLVLHSDNGAPMKAQTMKAKLEELGVLPSYSRPRVSNDNAFVESLFRVLKYRPQWPSRGFTSLEEARRWVDRFVRWYNTEHRHSKLRFVTPEQRHNGEDAVLLEQRKRVLEQAKQSMPSRWGTRPVRNCEPVGPTTLNPETELPMRQAA